jgi:hypothetical protein
VSDPERARELQLVDLEVAADQDGGDERAAVVPDRLVEHRLHDA